MLKKDTPLTILLLLILAALTPSPAVAITMSFERVTAFERNEASMGTVENIAEDSRGFIWLASRERLARYDGSKFRYYNDSPADPRGRCSRLNNDLLSDSRNNLWVATDTALCRYNPKKDYFEIYSLPLAANNIPAHANSTALAEDHEHNLIIGGRGGLTVISPNLSSAVYYELPNQSSARSPVTDIQTILVDSKNRIWLGTRDLGLVLFDLNKAHFTYMHTTTVKDEIDGANLEAIAEDIDGKLWLGYFLKGVERYDTTTGVYEHFAKDTSGLTSTTVWNIIRDSRDNIWFAADNGGLAQYNRETGQFDRQYHDASNLHSLASDKTASVFEDNQKNLWVSTYPDGIHFYHHKNSYVENYHHSLKHTNNQLNDNGVLSFFEDSDGTVLIGSEKGLNRFHPNTRKLDNLSDPSLSVAVPEKPITTITKDPLGYYWIGTWSDGIYRVNFDRNETKHFLAGTEKGSLSANIIWNFLSDSNKGLWIATQDGGLNYFDFSTQQFNALIPTSDRAKSISGTHIYAIQQDTLKNYWIAGISGLDYYLPQSGEFKHYTDNSENNKLIPPASLRALTIDKKGRLWVATEDDGIFIRDPVTETFHHLTQKEGLPNAHVTALIEDKNGNMWASTLLGLALINGETLAIKKFNQSQGILTTTINRGASMISRDGLLYAGGAEGFSVFKPENVDYKYDNFPVYITALKISNKTVSARNDNPILTEDISLTKNIELRYQDNMFAFEFIALNYHLPSWNRYAFTLEGFDKEWNLAEFSNSASYTNIPPGHYVFRVKAANSDGLWSEKTASINIHILPPPWHTPWAYLLYAFALIFLATLIYRYNVKKIEFQKEKKLNEELQKLSDIKDAFLANTSHELRTPINGMVGMAEALIRESNNATNSQKEKMQLIISSGKRLSSLINDILDYAKMADQDIVLYKDMINMQQLVKQVFEITAILAKNKNVRLVNKISNSANFLYADPNRMEQILINLVSNAIKYSDDGDIIVSAEIIDNYFTLTVKDSGIGIAEADLPRLFAPFSQLESSANHRSGGTGLGLTVTRHLIECHGGTISVNSTLGVGSQFTVSIPYAETIEQFNNSQKEIELTNATTNSAIQINEENHETQQHDQHKDDYKEDDTDEIDEINTHIEDALTSRPKILIADDDPVNCMILQQLLKVGGYSVISTYDGAMALDALQKNSDVVVAILDINMPKINGIEVAEKLRHDPTLHNLPVLFLSATITEQNRMDCTRIGNANIELKPLNKTHLYSILDELQRNKPEQLHQEFV